MRGKVLVKGLEVFAFHGCLPEEKEKGQTFLLDLEIECDMGPAADSDDLSQALDYDAVVREAHAIASAERYDLLESLAARLGRHLASRQGVEKVKVRIRKPDAPLSHPVEWVGVEAEFHGPADLPGGEG
jgi:dihydroneopterin aldolase